LSGRLLSGWAGLGHFWLIVLIVLGIGAGTLQVLGPPTTGPRRAAAAGPAQPADQTPKRTPDSQAEPTEREPLQTVPKVASRSTAPPGPGAPGRGTPGPVADPDPALLEPNVPPLSGYLPRIAVDGRTSMREYAAGFDPTSRRPRIGLIVGGIGMNADDSLAAVRQLPVGVTLAVSPYARDPARLLAAARIAQHEYLLSVPMEPQGFPGNDPDDKHALMTSLPEAENIDRLRWVLSRIGGYVGATNAFGPMRGERLSGVPDQFEGVLKELSGRGLLFIDARVGSAPLRFAWNRAVDVVIDDNPLDADAVDQRLTALAKLAQDKGSALGLISIPRPMTLDRTAVWAETLVEKGLVLAPVSALVAPPAEREGEAD
jgi:uncharacterized protein